MHDDGKSNFTDGSNILVHTHEVLTQATDAEVPPGEHAGGNAWFGTVPSCLELKMRYGINSTFIVKTNDIFSMIFLHRILLARHSSRPDRH